MSKDAHDDDMHGDEEREVIRGEGLEIFPGWNGLGPEGPPPPTNGQLTLALLEDLGAVL